MLIWINPILIILQGAYRDSLEDIETQFENGDIDGYEYGQEIQRLESRLEGEADLFDPRVDEPHLDEDADMEDFDSIMDELTPEELRILDEISSSDEGGSGRLEVENKPYNELGDDRICFPAGTLVHTSEGKVPIEEIKVGNEVFSFNPDSGEREIQPVQELFTTEPQHLFHIHFGDEIVSSTGKHPFWIPNRKRWIKAKDLVRGMQVLSLDNETITIDKISSEEISIITYNFTVAKNHNYFVGEQGILVHNTERTSKNFNSIETTPIDFYLITDHGPDGNGPVRTYVGQVETARGIDQRFSEHARGDGWKQNIGDATPSGDPRFTVERLGGGEFSPIGAAITERHLAAQNNALAEQGGLNDHTIIAENTYDTKRDNFRGPCIA